MVRPGTVYGVGFKLDPATMHMARGGGTSVQWEVIQQHQPVEITKNRNV